MIYLLGNHNSFKSIAYNFKKKMPSDVEGI